MKNKYIKAIILLIAIVGIAGKARQPKETTSPLMMENIEALANSEYNTGVSCFGSGDLKCPFNGTSVEYIVHVHDLEP